MSENTTIVILFAILFIFLYYVRNELFSCFIGV
jgi:hypothetical protein